MADQPDDSAPQEDVKDQNPDVVNQDLEGNAELLDPDGFPIISTPAQ